MTLLKQEEHGSEIPRVETRGLQQNLYMVSSRFFYLRQRCCQRIYSPTTASCT